MDPVTFRPGKAVIVKLLTVPPAIVAIAAAAILIPMPSGGAASASLVRSHPPVAYAMLALATLVAFGLAAFWSHALLFTQLRLESEGIVYSAFGFDNVRIPWEQVIDVCSYGQPRGEHKAAFILIEVKDFDLLYRCLNAWGRQRVRSLTHLGEGLPIYVDWFDAPIGQVLAEMDERWRNRVKSPDAPEL